jgi:hypothetical protein
MLEVSKSAVHIFRYNILIYKQACNSNILYLGSTKGAFDTLIINKYIIFICKLLVIYVYIMENYITFYYINSNNKLLFALWFIVDCCIKFNYRVLTVLSLLITMFPLQADAILRLRCKYKLKMPMSRKTSH